MTIQSETRLSGPYTGTGLVTVYPFTFKVFQASDLLVIQTDTSGNNTTLALTSNYSVSLNPDQNSNPGGSITLVSALPASYTLVISSQIPYQQTLDILNNQTWYPQVIEDALDRLTILIQQVKQSLGNALQLPLSSSGVSTTLPNPVASNFLGWNSAANAIINYAGVASAAVSTYMSGFVALTTAAASRAYIAAVGLADTNVWTATNTFTDTLLRILKNGSAFYARILATGLTANRDFSLQDKSGTLALLGDIIRNRIINPRFEIDQVNEGASSNIGTTLTWMVDQWYSFQTGATITGQKVTVSGQPRFRITGAASNTGGALGTRLKAAHTADLAGQTATLQVKASSTNITTLNWAAYYANSSDTFGSVASPTRTAIANGSFTINTTEATYSTQISIPSAATTGIEIVFSWGALLAAQTITFGDAGFNFGSSAMSIESRPDELQRCQEFLFKTFPQGTAPAQNAGVTGAFICAQPVGASAAGAKLGYLSFPIAMRAIPTVTLYNPQNTNAQIRNTDAAGDWASSTALFPSPSGCGFSGTTPGSTSAGQVACVHVLADARLTS